HFELHLNGALVGTSLDAFSGPQNILVSSLDTYTVHTGIPVFSKMPIDASVVSSAEGLKMADPDYSEITFDDIDLPSLHPLKILESGPDHSCVIEEQGDLYCWGEGSYGRLGQGVQTDSTPVKVNYPEPFIAVDAGYQTTCAISAAKRLVCWGNNGGHQVDMTKTGDTSAVYAPALNTAFMDIPIHDVSLASYSKNTCVITDVNRELYCMGSNAYSQLGIGSESSITQYDPVRVMMPDRVADVDLGGTHACAVLENADLYCWGYAQFGRVGHGSGSGEVASPEYILSDVKQVSAGSAHTCAVLNDGQVACWGEGANGRLGNAGTSDQHSPVFVDDTAWSPKAATMVVAGLENSCALVGDDLYCWGHSRKWGGHGTTGTQYDVPTLVDVGAGVSSVISIGIGDDQTCVLAHVAYVE
ncbi:MAG TPA: hypothetical protein QF646_00165, partial [Candidatus Poseidoniales archaeon]|nr:hypothetical protein [Candidatus Poseidoniales archaeon]